MTEKRKGKRLRLSAEEADIIYEFRGTDVDNINGNDNLVIETNIIKAAHEIEVKKLLFLGSSCIYPRDAKQPMVEEELLTGPLEKTNESKRVKI